MMNHYLAFLDPETIAVMIPIIGLLIPIVAILTKHQQRMAEIVHNGASKMPQSSELSALRQEVSELRQLIHQQTIALDNATSRSAMPTPDVSSRLGS